MDWYFVPLLVAAGFACGFVNVLAGSGSLLTLPLLIYMGLPPGVANATNRVAIVLQNIVAVESYRRGGALEPRQLPILMIPSIAGALVGARIALSIDDDLLKQTLGGLMVFMALLVLARPRRWLEGAGQGLGRTPGWVLAAVFFGIGLYGGFIQAGVGIFLLAGLVVGAGYDLVRANAVKVLLVLAFTLFALALFAVHGQVDWRIGLVLGVGNMAGAWVGTRMALGRGAGFVRRVLIVVVLGAGLHLLGAWQALVAWLG